MAGRWALEDWKDRYSAAQIEGWALEEAIDDRIERLRQMWSWCVRRQIAISSVRRHDLGRSEKAKLKSLLEASSRYRHGQLKTIAMELSSVKAGGRRLERVEWEVPLSLLEEARLAPGPKLLVRVQVPAKVYYREVHECLWFAGSMTLARPDLDGRKLSRYIECLEKEVYVWSRTLQPLMKGIGSGL